MGRVNSDKQAVVPTRVIHQFSVTVTLDGPDKGDWTLQRRNNVPKERIALCGASWQCTSASKLVLYT